MSNISDSEHEKIIRNLYVSHRRKQLEDKLLYTLLGISVLLLLMLVGGLISMLIK